MRAPTKVVELAVSNGAHRTCAEGSPDDSCAECWPLMMDAFDRFYGDLPYDRLRTRIAADIAAEGGSWS